MQNIRSTVTLANGNEIPILGFGTWNLKGEEGANAVSHALKMGYRHIDTASEYENEESVAEGIRRSGVSRDEIFITTKVWTDDIRAGTESIWNATRQSLKRLQTHFVNLLLIHWPVEKKITEAWKVFEQIYSEGLAKAIGVSNYNVHHLEELFTESRIMPMVNQIEYHPYLLQPKMLSFNEKHGIITEAWSPLMQGEVVRIQEIQEIAQRHQKTPAQVVLRWDLQHGVVTIPKSANPKRIEENAHIFDFELTAEEMQALNNLDRGKRFGPDPDNFDF